MNKQEGDRHEFHRESDPRGGVQRDNYRHADPTDIVVAEGLVMSGPGGAPQDNTRVEERRSDDRK